MDEPPRSDGPLAEFGALRAEILQLSQQQHQLVALHLTFTGALLAFAASRPSAAALSLVIPIVSYLFCLRSLNFSTEIQQIACYIREELDPKVPGGLGWEEWFLQHGRRNIWLGKIADSFSFPVASILALGWAFNAVFSMGSSGEPWHVVLIATWLLGACGVVHQSYELWIGDRRRTKWFRAGFKRLSTLDPEERLSDVPL